MAAKNVRLIRHANYVGAMKWGEACGSSKRFEGGMEEEDCQCSSRGVDVELRWKKVVKQLYGRLVRRKSDKLQSLRLQKQQMLAAAAWRKIPNAFGKDSVIFEDEHLIAVNKPAGFGNESVLSALVDLLGTADNQSCIQGLKLRIVQRLAEDTSGLLLVAKSSEIYDAMIQRPLRTRFIALVAAADDLPNFGSLLLESGYARLSSHKKYVWPISETGSKEGICRVEKIATRFDLVGFKKPDGTRIDAIAKNTRTNLVVETSSIQPMYRRIEESRGHGGEVLLRICPTTQFGDHQVRLHCEYLGLPILGDFEYGGPLRWNGVAHSTFTLHAASIRFRHPMRSDEIMNLGAPVPDWAACYGAHPE